MTESREFTPWDFFQLAKEAAEHEVELKIKLANAGLLERQGDRQGDPV